MLRCQKLAPCCDGFGGIFLAQLLVSCRGCNRRLLLHVRKQCLAARRTNLPSWDIFQCTFKTFPWIHGCGKTRQTGENKSGRGVGSESYWNITGRVESSQVESGRVESSQVGSGGFRTFTGWVGLPFFPTRTDLTREV